MPSESVKLIRLVSIEYASDGPLTVDLYTDLPGGMALMGTWTLAASSTRSVQTVTCEGTTRARTGFFRFTPGSSTKAYVYAASVYARKIGRTPSDWGWHPVPIVPTSEALQVFPLPIPPTPEQYSTFQLPIPPTPEGYGVMQIPIPATPDAEQWAEMPLDE